MFDSALVIIDELARPVLIIPEDLPKGNTYLHIVKDGLEIGVDSKLYGRISDIDEASLALIGMQEAVGMATFKGSDGEEMPTKIQYVAEVSEKRFG